MTYPVPGSPPAFNHPVVSSPNSPIAPAAPIVGKLQCAKCRISQSPGSISMFNHI